MTPRLRVTRDIPIDIMRWAGSPELIEVVTPFSREFVEQLKVVCADVTCRWVGDKKVWLVHPVCLPDVWWLVMEMWGEVDMDDETEETFLSQLKIDRASAEPVTLVLNAQGQITATYAGAADVTNLVQAATKRAGGCCPSSVQGGSKSCGPGK